jgi:hypothetical protein
MSRRDKIDDVLREIEGWPRADRLSLAMEILRESAAAAPSPAPRDTLSRALGLARGKGPPPTDEQVKQWIHEHRMRKYGA